MRRTKDVQVQDDVSLPALRTADFEKKKRWVKWFTREISFLLFETLIDASRRYWTSDENDRWFVDTSIEILYKHE